MHKLGIIGIILLLSGIGLAHSSSLGDKSLNCTCLKIFYIGPDGKNLTIDIYGSDSKCDANNTEISYMDQEGHSTVNGIHSPFCHCDTKCSLSCLCLKNLTVRDMVNTSLELSQLSQKQPKAPQP